MIIHLNADDVTVQLVGPGTPVGEDTVAEGKGAVVIADREHTIFVEGTLQTLRGLAFEGLSAPIPAGAPLFDGE